MSTPAQPHVAVVGAGLAGLTAARRLGATARVTVFEKARGVGGRMSTRRDPPWAFDHGAQYFTARSESFVRRVAAWEDAGLVRRWPERIVDLTRGRAVPRRDAKPRFVPTPGMNALCKHLARGLAVETGTRIERLVHEAGAWRLAADDGRALGAFDAVVISAPPAQAAALLAPAPALRAAAAAVAMDPCWAVLAVFDAALPLAFDAAAVHDSPLAWIARAQSKPERPAGAGDAWVLHATAEWSREHVDAPPDEVVAALRTALDDAVGAVLPVPKRIHTHRWLYARTVQPLGRPYLLDAARALGVCGDWMLGERVEAAYRSGATLAEALGSGMRPA